MKNILILLALLCSSAVIIEGQIKKVKLTESFQSLRNSKSDDVENGKWIDLISSENGFKISYPVKPNEEVSASPYSQTGKTVEYSLKTDLLNYSISVGDFSASFADTSDSFMKTFYDKFIDNLSKGEKLTVLKQSDFKIGDVFGREAVLKEDDYYVYYNRYIYKNGKLYLISATTITDLDKLESVNKYRRKFLDSFSFTQ